MASKKARKNFRKKGYPTNKPTEFKFEDTAADIHSGKVEKEQREGKLRDFRGVRKGGRNGERERERERVIRKVTKGPFLRWLKDQLWSFSYLTGPLVT